MHILRKFKFEDPNPVVVISGGRDVDAKRSKFLGGIARAAFNTDAVIIDSGVGCCMMPFGLDKPWYPRWHT